VFSFHPAYFSETNECDEKVETLLEFHSFAPTGVLILSAIVAGPEEEITFQADQTWNNLAARNECLITGRDSGPRLSR